MNTLERLLQDDLDLLIDRIAATAPPGLLADCLERRPDLLPHLDESEARLSAARQALLQDYAVWRQALEQCGDLWALAGLAAECAPAGERRAA